MRFLPVVLVAFFSNIVLAQPTCDDLFRSPESIEILCDARCTTAPGLAHAVAAGLLNRPAFNKFGKRARGYAIITASMVASAAVSAKLAAELPKDMAFLSTLVGQVSTIGIFVLGAPIWEPISSAFRKFAFGLGAAKNAPAPSDQSLEKMWQQTQGRYSLNAQMSRNVIQSFILAAHANFESARQAMRAGDEALAVDQIAETAVRVRRLFAEIDPEDSSVALAVQATFTRHVKMTPEFSALVLHRIFEIEQFEPPEPIQTIGQHADATGLVTNRRYYDRLLKTWLTKSVTG